MATSSCSKICIAALALSSVWLLVGCTPTKHPTNPVPEHVTTLRVPLGYGTIQAAIDAAVDGDTVLIAIGRYAGIGNTNLDLRGKRIRVMGAGVPDSTVIDCRRDDGTSTNGFVLRRGEDRQTFIKSLTITRAGTGSDGGGLAIACTNASPTFDNCNIRDNRGTVIVLRRSSALFNACRIEANMCPIYSYVLDVWSSTPTFQACQIVSNRSAGSPILMSVNGYLDLDDCRIERNLGGVSLGLERTAGRIRGCTFAHNVNPTESGGALAMGDGSSVFFQQCTFAENATEWSGGGLAVGGGSSAELLQCIVSHNCATRSENEVDVGPGGVVTFVTCAVDSSKVGGGGFVLYRDKLVTSDPMFCQISGCGTSGVSDYRLQPGSPCGPGVGGMGAHMGPCE